MSRKRPQGTPVVPMRVLGRTILVKKARPTRGHRLAISPGILGTVYAVDEHGTARYFDYDRDAAYAFAGLDAEDADVRLSVPAELRQYVRRGALEANPGKYTRCLWVRKES